MEINRPLARAISFHQQENPMMRKLLIVIPFFVGALALICTDAGCG